MMSIQSCISRLVMLISFLSIQCFTDGSAIAINNQKIQKKKYSEIKYPTPNIDKDRVNSVEGVILHHTAEPTVEKSLAILTSLKKKVGTHVVIDTDGTRYIMASPETVTFPSSSIDTVYPVLDSSS